jgi:hypothetical protein
MSSPGGYGMKGGMGMAIEPAAIPDDYKPKADVLPSSWWTCAYCKSEQTGDKCKSCGAFRKDSK